MKLDLSLVAIMGISSFRGKGGKRGRRKKKKKRRLSKPSKAGGFAQKLRFHHQPATNCLPALPWEGSQKIVPAGLPGLKHANPSRSDDPPGWSAPWGYSGALRRKIA